MSSLSECLPWMTVGLAESIAIVTLNLCTIIVFIRNRNLRKRSTYLVINLAVMDMFVGGVNVQYNLFYVPGIWCNLWKWHVDEANIFISVLLWLFLSGSLINVTIIALERVHATFFPFRHRVFRQSVYRLAIAVVWVTSGLITVALTLLGHFNHFVYLFISFFSICLLIISVSYTCIVIKFRCGAQPQPVEKENWPWHCWLWLLYLFCCASHQLYTGWLLLSVNLNHGCHRTYVWHRWFYCT